MPATASEQRVSAPHRLLGARGWPLLAVLVIQGLLSARMIWAQGAFQDEAMYLWAGHVEIAHVLHGQGAPDYARFLSGSPAIYPALGAAADAVAGLAGARLLSLAFMLVATVLLHGVTRRLLGGREGATFAAALFGWLAATQFLGAYATFDAMALMLLALATWLGVHAAQRAGPTRASLLTTAAITLAFANATKYASALFDPVVIAIVACAAWQACHRIMVGILASGWLALLTAGLTADAYLLGGSSYATGVDYTTVKRTSGQIPATFIWGESVRWIGVVVGLAIIASVVITLRTTGWADKLLAWTLAGAGFLATVEQARIHTITSLFKHAGFGAWFSAALAGSLLAGLPQITRAAAKPQPAPTFTGRLRVVASVAVVALATGIGVAGAANHDQRSWPNEKGLIAVMRRFEQAHGRYLVEDPPVPAYYLMTTSHWYQWYSTQSLNYFDPDTGMLQSGPPAFAGAIKNKFFTVIVLWFGDTYTTDKQIVHDIKLYRTYRLAAAVPFRKLDGSIGHFLFWVPKVLKVVPVDAPGRHLRPVGSTHPSLGNAEREHHEARVPARSDRQQHETACQAEPVHPPHDCRRPGE
jgi:hypothetical protein